MHRKITTTPNLIWLLILVLISSAPVCFGQATATITATVTDPDSTAWATLNSVNATYTIQLVSASGVPIPAGQAWRTDTGATITNTFTGNLSSSGGLSVSLTVNSYINPASTQWKFTVCPAVSSPTCASVTLPVTTSASFSTQLSAATTAPRITGGQGAFAYNDTEVAAIPNNSYYNITTPALRCYAAAWAACGGGGSSGVTSFTGDGVLITNSASTGVVTATLGYTPAHSGANSDITSLTGIATPLTKAQGGTGNALGGGLALISKQVLASPAATVTFSSIPQTYTHLKLIISAASSDATTTDTVAVQMNGDSTSGHYLWQILYGSGSSALAGGATGSAMSIGDISGTTSGVISGNIDITLANYSGTVFDKCLTSNTAVTLSTSLVYAFMLSGCWNSTAAVNSMVFSLTSADNFITGSTFSLYGLQ